MDPTSLFGILTLGFSLGLLHALDADHIMAVSVLSTKTRHLKSRFKVALVTCRYCLKWALGHGGVLLFLGVLLLFLEIQLPPTLSFLAEKAVGVFLVAMGVWIIWQARDSNLRLNVHKHSQSGEEIHHVHLASESDGAHSHKPMLIGMTHGLAGSAPMLALLPAIGNNNHWLAITYLMLFSGGVLVSMLLFGLFFGQLLGWIDRLGNRVFRISRWTLGLTSALFGSYWLIA